MIYRLHPEASSELSAAAAYYFERAGNPLSQSFLADFEHGMGLLLQFPRPGAPWRGHFRRLLFRHFPYAVIYSLAEDEVRVVAVAHTRRQPSYWRSRA